MFYKINKPRGISSFKAIKKFAKENNIKKIGHGGTLDPLAEGLLIVATNHDTKALSYLLADTKSYYVEATLHQYSASYDEGEEVFNIENYEMIDEQTMLSALDYIKNQTEQIPPIFSAKKVDGVRSYLLARNNKEVELKPSKIEILDLELIDFDYEKQKFAIRCKVSKGTYIRSLIHDIGLHLKTDAVVNILRREKIGNIELNNNKEFEEINNLNKLFNVKLYVLSEGELKLLAKSKELYIKELQSFCGNLIFTYLNRIIAWGNITDGHVIMAKVFCARIEAILKGENYD
ncbi:tRNA pseudouridine(55) synthase TruB [Metamycoplasma spumans]|uniref:tRNA pseudouridine(55) synthase TruB n=1 Tax=Metamycoplasma spumans TaxID=92406 RepID=UPI0034DD15F9